MTRAQTLTLRSGVPLGVIAGLTAWFGAAADWWMIPVSIAVCGVIVGVAHAYVLDQFTRRVNRRPLTIFVLACISVIAGVVISGATTYGISKLLPVHSRWTRIAIAPEPLVALRGPNCYYEEPATLYAVASSGASLRLARGRSGKAAAWERVDSIPTAADKRASCDPKSGRRVVFGSPALPEKTVLSHVAFTDGVDCADEIRFALTADQTIWAWATGMCSIGVVVTWMLLIVVSAIASLSVALWLSAAPAPHGWSRFASAAGE